MEFWKNNHTAGPPGEEGEVGKHLPVVSPHKAPTEMTRRWGVLGYRHGRLINSSDFICRNFPQPGDANSKIEPQTRLTPLPSTSLPIHSSINITRSHVVMMNWHTSLYKSFIGGVTRSQVTVTTNCLALTNKLLSKLRVSVQSFIWVCRVYSVGLSSLFTSSYYHNWRHLAVNRTVNKTRYIFN